MDRKAQYLLSLVLLSIVSGCAGVTESEAPPYEATSPVKKAAPRVTVEAAPRVTVEEAPRVTVEEAPRVTVEEAPPVEPAKGATDVVKEETAVATVAPPPILVFAVDGLEWDIILPMLKAGRLPNLAQLMERGCYGDLDTFVPTQSPVIWTTVATGKPRQKHGILNFAKRMPDGKLTLSNRTDRRTKAIWNILSDYERTVATIGWWMTYPVEKVNGIMVAQTNTRAQLNTGAGKNVMKGVLLRGVPHQVFPPERQNEMMGILAEADRKLPDLTREIFGEFEFSLSELGKRLWLNCLWAFRADATYLRIALHLARERPLPNLTLLYFGGPDVVGHRFIRYMNPDLYQHKPTPEQIQNFGDIIEDYYAYTDRSLGQLIEAYGPETTYFVVSDHGMKAVNLDARFDPDHPPNDIQSGAHRDAPPGVLFAAGPLIRKAGKGKPPGSLQRADLESVGGVLDITPTILAMLQLPVGKDMDGHVLSGIFTDDFRAVPQPEAVKTHDTPGSRAAPGMKTAPHPGEAERLKQLRSLGYLK